MLLQEVGSVGRALLTRCRQIGYRRLYHLHLSSALQSQNTVIVHQPAHTSTQIPQLVSFPSARMDSDDDALVSSLLGGASSSWRPPPVSRGSGPLPRNGENRDFDQYCRSMMDGEFSGDREAEQEMRRALWATWKIEAPQGREIPQGSRVGDEDAELARALAESAKEAAAPMRLANAGEGSKASAPIVLSDDEDDTELKRIIEMSEREHREPKRQRRDSTPDEERRALAEAMAASLAEDSNRRESVDSESDDEAIAKANDAYQASRQAFRAEELKKRNGEPSRLKAKPAPISVEGSTSSTPIASPALSTASSSLLGDRAQMEKERLARQAARLEQTSAATSAPSSSRPAAVLPSGPPKIATFSNLQNGSSTNGAAKSSSSRTPSHHPMHSNGPSREDAAGEMFLDGEVRHTRLDDDDSRLKLRPSAEKTFTPQQVIGEKDQISLIIMSTFVADDEWVEMLLPPAQDVPRIVARPQPKEFHQAWNGKVQRQDNGEIRCYPLMVGQYGSAHMKYFWIFYKTGRVRVAIMTANMVHYDWDWIENSIFVQDFLPRGQTAGGSSAGSSSLPDFPSQFRDLFVHLKVHKALRHLIQQHPKGPQIPIRPDEAFADFEKYDWSRVRAKLVMSVPGNYDRAEKMDNYGICRLGKILSENGWKPQKGEIAKLEYQGSSLGTYSADWINTFYSYASGKTTREQAGGSSFKQYPPIKVLFPSLATVEKSAFGKDASLQSGGGTMFCGRAHTPQTEHLFHDANSKRGGVLMHAKVMVAMFEPRPDHLGVTGTTPSGKRKLEEMDAGTDGVGGWCYIGSHNFSNAAWGNAKLKGSSPSLTIRNYELGVVFPIPRKDAQKAIDAVVPYVRPPRKYTSTDKPWNQATHNFGS